jgi:plasmid stabilization system protein ParE
MTVRYTARATRDLDAIYTYIAQHNRRAATAVSSAILKRGESLGDFPQLGHPTENRGYFVLSVGRYPYLIFYRLLDDEVQIVHIRHDMRSPFR